MNPLHRWYCPTGHWRDAIQDQPRPCAQRDVDLGGDAAEAGPGPGLTTDVLATNAARLTAVEIDDDLTARLNPPGAAVHYGDATAMPFDDGSFDTVACFTMLHHVPSVDLQDRPLADIRRVLRSGGTFAGSDSETNRLSRLAHVADAMALVDPATFGSRLAATGLDPVTVEPAKSAFQFKAIVPATDRASA